MNRKSIITFSRRSDPAFFMDWFMESLNAGFCEVPNPFSGKLYRVGLTPDEVLLLTFWTKDPRAILERITGITERGLKSAFFISMTGYPEYIETNVPSPDALAPSIRELSLALTPDAIWWRYDPVIFTEKLSPQWHVENFRRLCESVWCGATRRVIFSLAHIDGSYSAVRPKLERACVSASDCLCMPSISGTEYKDLYAKTLDLFGKLSSIASEFGISAEVCCSPKLNEEDKKIICQGSCLSKEYIERIVPVPDIRVRGTRGGKGLYADCTCLESRDIGINNTCRHGCVYCYANRRQNYMSR